MGNEPSVDNEASLQVLQGLLDAMEMEGYAETKPPCNYSPALINPQSPTCIHGDPWNMINTQRIMGGDLPGTNMSISDDDNAHPVQETSPVHLSEIDSDCAIDSVDCVMQTVSVSENHYEDYDAMDTGSHPQAASEIKTKLSSR